MKRELDAVVTQMHDAGISYDEAVRHFKRRYLLEVLTRHKGNQCKAAEELGMHRNTLSRTLSELEMTKAQIRMGVRRPPSSERPRTLEEPMRVNERVRSFGVAMGATETERTRIQSFANRTASPSGIQPGNQSVRVPRPLR
ncbi:MAG: hypothetical protein HIU93_12665 [Acidobacteria bacterium]|nr:hypothetical protein [Acidobacteriota bacterium]